MRAGRGIAVAAGLWAGAWLGGAALAQQVLPAESPPPSFEGTQYVDSAGCAFIRAGVGGNATFVPRLSPTREPVCGLVPSVIGPTSMATTAVADAPDATGSAERPAIAPMVMAEAPAPAPRRPASPQSPAAVSDAAPVAAAPVRLPFEEACAGRVGVQAGLRDARSGHLVDCGTRTHPVASAPLSGPGPLGAPHELPYLSAPLAVVAVCSYGIVGSTGRVQGGPACQTTGGLRAVAVSDVDATRATVSPSAAPLPTLRAAIPASNPVGVVSQVVPVARGYEGVWEDGRVNPSRGVPQPVSGPVLLGATLATGH